MPTPRVAAVSWAWVAIPLVAMRAQVNVVFDSGQWDQIVASQDAFYESDDAPYPEFVPAYDDLLVDTRGRLWVRDFRIDKSATSHYTVFERNGITTAAIAMPGGFEPTDIDDGFIVGIWKDEFDIESVRVYTLHTN